MPTWSKLDHHREDSPAARSTSWRQTITCRSGLAQDSSEGTHALRKQAQSKCALQIDSLFHPLRNRPTGSPGIEGVRLLRGPGRVGLAHGAGTRCEGRPLKPCRWPISYFRYSTNSHRRDRTRIVRSDFTQFSGSSAKLLPAS